MTQGFKTFILWLLIILVFIALYKFFQVPRESAELRWRPGDTFAEDGIPFGWARPVSVDPLRFRDDVSMARGLVLTAAAGPASNLALALICAAILRAVHSIPGLPWDTSVEALLAFSLQINIALAIFNLLPIPPLDGSRIVDGFVPFGWRDAWNSLSSFGGILLVILLVAPTFLGVSLGRWMAQLSGILAGR
jgi:Zn-dependent protease